MVRELGYVRCPHDDLNNTKTIFRPTCQILLLQ